MTSLGGFVYHLGVWMQIGGVVAAVILLARLKEAITGRPNVVRRLYMRVGTRRRNVMLEGRSSSSAAVSMTVDARVTLRETLPPELTDDERDGWLWSQVRRVHDFAEDVSARVTRIESANSKELARLRSELQSEIETAKEEAREHVFSTVGGGLSGEMLSLGAIALGILLASYAEGVAAVLRATVPGL